jgi:hypothetical protein
MGVSMHPISVSVFLKHLTGLAGCLGKAQAHYASAKYDETSLLHYRFYPDMFNFTRQVQAACDHARTCTALLAGIEAPKHEDGEPSLAGLLARVEQTIAFLKSVGPAQVEGSEDRSVTLKLRDREQQMKGL